jgi:hypothetical protein
MVWMEQSRDTQGWVWHAVVCAVLCRAVLCCATTAVDSMRTACLEVVARAFCVASMSGQRHVTLSTNHLSAS